MVSFEQILANIKNLTLEQKEQLQKALSESQKSGDKSALSKELQEIFTKCRQNRSQILCCPHCGSVAVVRNGRKAGRQRYLCKNCHKTFGDTFGTFLWHCKLSYDCIRNFLEMNLLNISIHETVDSMESAELNMNKNTIWYNRHNLCENISQLEGEQDDFASICEADEYYLPLSFIGVKNPQFFIEVLGRMPNHNRGRQQRYEYAEKAGYSVDLIESVPGFEKSSEDKSAMKISNQLNNTSDKTKVNAVLANIDNDQKRKRGISNQQVCILSCVDLDKGMYFSPTCVGRLTPKHIELEIGDKFSKDSILVADSRRAYKTFANKHDIHLRQIPPGKHTSGPYNLAKLNSYHSKLTAFVNQYKEFSSKYSDHYIALFRYQEKVRNLKMADKIEDLMDRLTMGMSRENVGFYEFRKRAMPFDTKGLF